MEPVDIYLMYCALKAHFNSDYDFFKYGGKTKISRNSFFKRKDRFFFVKLSRKYKEYSDIRNYLIANFVIERRGYVANFTEENYENWLDRRNNFDDIFTKEMLPLIKNFEPLFEVRVNSHPKLLQEYLGKRVSLETLVTLDNLLGFVKKWDRSMSEDFIWSDVKKLIKSYKGFLTIDVKQCRIHLLKLIEEVN